MYGFKYNQPTSLNVASKFLKDNSDSSVVYAGGTDALALIKEKIYNPLHVVNLKSIPELNKLEYFPNRGLTIGSLVKIESIAQSKDIQRRFAVLSEAAKEVATPQLRNVGTIGGNICQRPRCWYFRGDFNCLKKGGDECYAIDGENKYHCIIGGGPCYIVHPSDLSVALLVLHAEVSIYSKNQIRKIPIKDFFVLPKENVLGENILKPGEIVTEIFIPELEEGTKSSYIKIKERGTWDFALVSLASVIKGNTDYLEGGRLAFGGIAPIPWYEHILNKELTNLKLTEKNIDYICGSILKDAEPLEHNEYKLVLAKNLIKKLLTKLEM